MAWKQTAPFLKWKSRKSSVLTTRPTLPPNIWKNYPPNGRWWIYTERRSVDVYIHCSSPTLRGIVILAFTKSDGYKTLLQFLLLKLSRNGAPFFSLFAKQWISKDIPRYGSQSKRTRIALCMYVYITVDWGEESGQVIAWVKMWFGRELNPGLQTTSRMP